MATPSKEVLKRYTTLSVAIDMLTNKRLTLLSPDTWQDKNDIAFLEAYREKRKVQKIFVGCFTQASERYHHWSVFAGGSEGVRINIDKDSLLQSLNENIKYRHGDVEYKTLDAINRLDNIKLSELPFLKRYAFKDEGEFRLLYECSDCAQTFHHVPIERSWIKSITLSPWLPENLVDPLKKALKLLPGFVNVRLQHTKLRDSPRWKSAIGRVNDDD